MHHLYNMRRWYIFDQRVSVLCNVHDVHRCNAIHANGLHWDCQHCLWYLFHVGMYQRVLQVVRLHDDGGPAVYPVQCGVQFWLL